MDATVKDWLGSFWNILIRPTESTFVNEAKKAEGKTFSAVGSLVLFTAFFCLYNLAVLHYDFSKGAVILGFIIIPLYFLVLAFSLDTLYRKIFHRQKSYYEEFLYIGVVIFIISQLLFYLLIWIPFLGTDYLAFTSIAVAYLYPIVLLIVAVKSLTKLTAWQATLTVILGVGSTIIGWLCMIVFMLGLMRAVPGVL